MKRTILSVVVLAAGTAYAGEAKLEVKDLPKPVLAAVKAKFPEAKVTGAAKEEEDGKTIYEVAIKDDEMTADLAVSPKGKILEVEKEISAKKLPEAVTAALEAKYPKAKIKKAEEVIKYEDDEEEKSFEVVVLTPGKEDAEVVLSPKGKILKGPGVTAAEDDDDDDDDKAKKQDSEDEKGKKKDKAEKGEVKEGKKKDKN